MVKVESSGGLSSVVCRLSSVVCRLSSVVCRLSSVVCRLSLFFIKLLSMEPEVVTPPRSYVSLKYRYRTSNRAHAPSVVCSVCSVSVRRVRHLFKEKRRGYSKLSIKNVVKMTNRTVVTRDSSYVRYMHTVLDAPFLFELVPYLY
jgi:hypothetical protein